MTPIITFTTGCGGASIERLETRPAGCMAVMAEIPRNRRRWVLPAALVVAGVLMMVIGAFWPGGYASAVWLQVGSAFALFGPLFWAQKRLERGITEVRQEGRQTRSGLKLGICGEHGGDPDSVRFCHELGLDYVSCSPFRVPTARLAAGQAALGEATAASK
jgi:hypothetical protein